MKSLIRIVVLLVIVLAAIGFFLPRYVHVERSTTVNAPIGTVYAVLNSYKLFNRWSPWAALDPNTKYEFSGPAAGVGSKMSWSSDNKNVGKGSQEITESRAGEYIKTALDFGTNGKGTADFKLSRDAEGTKVVWGMDSDLGANPFAHYFGLMIPGMVGKDYEKGLASLKNLVETLPKADFSDLSVESLNVTPVMVAFIPGSSTQADSAIAAALGASYMQVGQFMGANGLKQAGPPMSITRKWENNKFDFDAAIQVDKSPDAPVPADSKVQIKQTYGGAALRVVHRGAYHGLAATTEKFMAYAAAHGIEMNGDCWEEFVSDPGNTPEPELITHIYMPIK